MGVSPGLRGLRPGTGNALVNNAGTVRLSHYFWKSLIYIKKLSRESRLDMSSDSADSAAGYRDVTRH